MALETINFGKYQTSLKGAVSLHEIEIRALGTIVGDPGGSAVDTLLATFTTTNLGETAFTLVNQTAVNIAQFFTGNFPGDIRLNSTEILEDIKIKYRVTDSSGISDWVEKDVIRRPETHVSFVSSNIASDDLPSTPKNNINLSAYKIDFDNKRLDLDSADTAIIEIYSPRLLAVVASCEFYIAQDITDDNEGISYVVGTNNNWFDTGNGFGDFLTSVILDATLLRTDVITTTLNKRLWAEARGYIGTDMGDDYEIRFKVKDGATGVESTEDNAIITKMFGMTFFEIDTNSPSSDPGAPYNTCLNNSYWNIRAVDSYRGDLSDALTREFIDATTLEQKLNGGAWAPTSFIDGTVAALCMVQTGTQVDDVELRFDFKVPASFPWVGIPPVGPYEIKAKRNSLSTVGDEYNALKLNNAPYSINNNREKLITIDAEIRSDSGTRVGSLIEFNVYFAPDTGDDPESNNAFFFIYYAFETSSINQITDTEFPLKNEGWYKVYLENVAVSGTSRVINAYQNTLLYFYSF